MQNWDRTPCIIEIRRLHKWKYVYKYIFILYQLHKLLYLFSHSIARISHIARILYEWAKIYIYPNKCIRLTIPLDFTATFPRDFPFKRADQKAILPVIRRASEVAPVFRLICQNQFELRRRKASLWGSKTVSDLQFLAKNTRKRGCILGQAYSYVALRHHIPNLLPAHVTSNKSNR